MNLLRRALLIAVLAPLALVAPARNASAQPVEITYIANEGFLVSADGRKVLVDGLFRDGVEGYEKLSEEERAMLEEARPPFHDIDLVLVTHLHGDHFDPIAVGTHLLNNDNALLVTTTGALSQMRRLFDPFQNIGGRVRSGGPAEGDRERHRHNGVDLEVLNLHHGRRFAKDVENLGFVFEIGTRRFLHMGDSAGDERDLRRNRLHAEHFDVAFVPFWYLSNPDLESAGALIDATHIVVMHLPLGSGSGSKGGNESVNNRIRKRFPNTVFFEHSLESLRLFDEEPRD